tara:strand:+ start:251 stop:757 length:507 start_codon:yes stop_codon:yes gene_type:complete
MFKISILKIGYILCLLLPISLYSQALKETLSIQGGSSKVEDSYVSFTIGQPLSTGLYTNSNRTLIQGFEYVLENTNLEPYETFLFAENTLSVSIFPNPFQKSIFIEGEDDIFPVNVYIFDMIGRLISSYEKKSHLERTIILDNLKQAHYIIRIESKARNFNTVLIKKD